MKVTEGQQPTIRLYLTNYYDSNLRCLYYNPVSVWFLQPRTMSQFRTSDVQRGQLERALQVKCPRELFRKSFTVIQFVHYIIEYYNLYNHFAWNYHIMIKMCYLARTTSTPTSYRKMWSLWTVKYCGPLDM